MVLTIPTNPSSLDRKRNSLPCTIINMETKLSKNKANYRNSTTRDEDRNHLQEANQNYTSKTLFLGSKAGEDTNNITKPLKYQQYYKTTNEKGKLKLARD